MYKLFATLLMTTLMLWSVSSSYAQILDKYVEDGKLFLSTGEGLKAFQSLSDGDKINNIDTRYYLALCYENGYGVEKDSQRAFYYMRRAAESGNDDAKAACALMLVRGEGVDKNETKAKYWVEKLLMAHKPQGYYLKGVMLCEGLLYNQDVDAGIEMIEKAIDKGNVQSYIYLAFHLAPSDPSKSLDLIHKACELMKNNYMTLDKMGELLLLLNHQDEAKELWNQMTSYSPAYGMEFFSTFATYMKSSYPLDRTLIARYQSSRESAEIQPIVPATKAKEEKLLGQTSSAKGHTTPASSSNISPLSLSSLDKAPENTNKTAHNSQSASTTDNTSNNSLSDVDVDIPVNSIKNDNYFAVIIGNENYQDVEHVPYANRDSEIFSQYCLKTLGMPQSNVHLVKDATLNNIKREINWLEKIVEAYGYDASILFYYAGHGIPDESTKDAYLLPIDGFGSDSSTGYSLSSLYSQLGGLQAKSITVFLDACFSGASREGNMVASARGVAIAPKKTEAKGNVVILSATQDDETAYPLKEEKHGLFTYFLLKKLKQTRGSVSLGELSDFITDNVRKKSIVINGKSQTPTVNASNSLTDDWRNLLLK